MESALESIRLKTINGYRLMAYFMFAAAVVFMCFGIYEIIEALSSGTWFLALFMPGLAVVFAAVGMGSLRLVRSKA